MTNCMKNKSPSRYPSRIIFEQEVADDGRKTLREEDRTKNSHFIYDLDKVIVALIWPAKVPQFHGVIA